MRPFPFCISFCFTENTRRPGRIQVRNSEARHTCQPPPRVLAVVGGFGGVPSRMPAPLGGGPPTARRAGVIAMARVPVGVGSR